MGFEARHNRGAYTVLVSGMRTDDKELYFKFDTGASNTVLSIRALTDAENAAKKIRKYCEKHGIGLNRYYSASGHAMYGVAVKAENIVFEDYAISSLYYNLILNVNNNVALLGDDFISYCDFKHTQEESIIIEAFNVEKYQKNAYEVFSQSEIYEILSIDG